MRTTIFTTIFCLTALTQGLAIPKRQNTDMAMPAVSEPTTSIPTASSALGSAVDPEADSIASPSKGSLATPADSTPAEGHKTAPGIPVGAAANTALSSAANPEADSAAKPAMGSPATPADPIPAGGHKTAPGIPFGAAASPAGTPADPSTAKGGKKAPGAASDITGAVGLGLGGFLTPAGAITSSVAAGLKMGGLKREEEKSAADAIMEAPSAPTIPTVPGLDAENGLGRARKPGNTVDAGAPHGPKKAPGSAASTATGAVGLGLGGFLTPAGAITSTVAAGLKAGGL
ncbi:hypothetical protein EYC80_008240 [Monilinia laxa]|uniref:Uncharacterized protein n=1 Tax=Monilinia laxa TaxID=61186 RepID=A0A5N6JVR5_MONLA|nr:hypothetical protein EYC80_008240 [Monilinia laxa]